MTKKKNTTPTDDELLFDIKARLICDLNALGIDASLYTFAIDLATTTLYEREKAYEAYKAHGSQQTTEDGKNNPYAVRLQSWNSQARACLTMLRLTPPYKRAEDINDTNDIDDILTT